MLANPNLLFFYPYTLLLILLPFDLAYTLHFVLHFALAGIGTYLLARTWGQSYLAAFFAAFVFVFSGQVLSLGNVYNTVACCRLDPLGPAGHRPRARKQTPALLDFAGGGFLAAMACR